MTRPSNPSGGLTAHVVQLNDLTPDQRDQWARLFAEQTGPGNPFCSPIWVGSWYRQYVPSADRRLLWATEGGRLVGVAPLYVQHLQLGGLPLADRLTMVGAGRTTPFELPQVLSAPGQGRAVSRAVVNRTLDQRVAWTELSLTRDQGWFTPGISGGWQGHRIGFQRHQESRACVVLPLADTWQTTRSGLKRNIKESLRRARNRLAKDGRSWEIRHRTGAELDVDVVDGLLALHAARSRYTGSRSDHHDAFAASPSRSLIRGVLPKLGAAGQATVLELELGGRVVAAQLVLHAPGTVYFHSSGFLPEVWDLSPITALQESALIAAIDRGDRWVNFSPGPNEAKLRWSETLHVVDDFAYGPSGRGALARYTAFSMAKDVRHLRYTRSIGARDAAQDSGTAGR